MIKGIVQSGRYVSVSNSITDLPYIPSNANNPVQGMIRVNNQNMQAFDGSSWVTITGSIGSIGLNPEAESLLDWARKKRDEEMAWESLANESQAVKIALENLEQARRQLEITAKLAREYDKETTS
jgi:hypothetical protein